MNSVEWELKRVVERDRIELESVGESIPRLGRALSSLLYYLGFWETPEERIRR